MIMKPEEIRKLSLDKIETELDEAREELMRLRFRKATGELTNTALPRDQRRKVARLETILRERRAEQKAEGEA
jgi:large subunit ribosomal protein L29